MVSLFWSSHILVLRVLQFRAKHTYKCHHSCKTSTSFYCRGGCNLCIASNLLLKGFTHTLLLCINILLPMYCRLVLNNWHFFGEIFNPFFNNAFNKSPNLSICKPFEGVNNRRSSIIASQYFLFWRQSKMALIWDCQMEGEIFNPMGILWYK